MGLAIRFCACGKVLPTKDIQEGRPCKACREKKGLKIPLLDKVVRKPNPAKDIWLDRQLGGKT